MSETGGSAELADGIPADEVIAALADYQQRTVALFERHRGEPEVCVMALIQLHLAWTEEDPDRARRVARHRGAVMASPHGERLATANAAYFKRIREWLDHETTGGRLPAISVNLLHALVFAPAQELAKLWLDGSLRRRPVDYAEALGRAAWAGILTAGPVRDPDRVRPGS